MLPLGLFRRHNFAVGNLETLSMYAGLSLLFFFLVLFLQNAAGYSAVAAGSAALPVTIVMFLLSMRFGALADRYGPRFFMGVGPLVAAVGTGAAHAAGAPTSNYVTDLLPPLLIFARRAVDDGGPAHRHRARGRRRAQRRASRAA